MQAKREFRDRDEPQVAVLDALADRHEEGMTVFEIRSRVDVDIDTLEAALAELKADDLIEVTEDDGRTLIVPDGEVVGPENPDDGNPDIFDELRRRLPF